MAAVSGSYEVGEVEQGPDLLPPDCVDSAQPATNLSQTPEGHIWILSHSRY